MLLILLTNVTVMNMLVGVLCEVVSTVAATKRNDAALKVMKAFVLLELKRFDVYSKSKITTKELSVLVKGLIGALKVMLWIIMLRVVIIFAMGLFCVSLVKADAYAGTPYEFVIDVESRFVTLLESMSIMLNVLILQ